MPAPAFGTLVTSGVFWAIGGVLSTGVIALELTDKAVLEPLGQLGAAGAFIVSLIYGLRWMSQQLAIHRQIIAQKDQLLMEMGDKYQAALTRNGDLLVAEIRSIVKSNDANSTAVQGNSAAVQSASAAVHGLTQAVNAQRNNCLYRPTER